jgi:TIR domain
MKIYLSYATPDREFAKQLASHLTRRGYDVWDPETELLPGENYGLKLGKALRDSRAMVVLLSPDSVKSGSVTRDIEYAVTNRSYEGRVFPVLVRPTDGIPWILRELGILHTSGRPEAASKRIANALKQAA